MVERHKFRRTAPARRRPLSCPAFPRDAAQQIANARTDKAVAPIQIDHQDQVGEALQQVAAGTLPAAQSFFHLAPLGDIHQRALVADDLARVVPDRARRIQKDAGRAILAPQRELAAALAPAIVRAPAQHRTLAAIEIERCWDRAQASSSLLPQPEHLDQRRIGVEQLAFRRAEVHAFLQGLEQFGEAAFFLALFGHVPARER